MLHKLQVSKRQHRFLKFTTAVVVAMALLSAVAARAASSSEGKTSPHQITQAEIDWATRQAYLENTKALLAENSDAVAVYECERKKVVAVSENTKDFEPHMYINDPYSGEKMLPYFTVIVIPTKPDVRCAAGYYDEHPFVKWMRCSAKYKIADDGGKKIKPRDYSLEEMSSDDGNAFYGTSGLYFRGPGLGHTYLIEYQDEGDRFLETGTCEKKKISNPSDLKH